MSKLFEAVQQKGPVAADSAPVAPAWPELARLWEVGGGGSEGDAACTALVTLVRTRRLHLAYVLHGFINQAPTTKYPR